MRRSVERKGVGKFPAHPNLNHRVLYSMQITAPEIFQHIGIFELLILVGLVILEKSSLVPIHRKKKSFLLVDCWLKCIYINAIYENDNFRSTVECLINIRSIRIGMCNSRINHSALGSRSVRRSDRKEQERQTS